VNDPSQRGSVSIVVVGVVAIALVASLGVADVGKALVARARARAAADAAALAAAQELALPTGRDPAELANDYAARNGAALVSCACPPGLLEAVVEVDAQIGAMFLTGDDVAVRARARAVIDVPVGSTPVASLLRVGDVGSLAGVVAVVSTTAGRAAGASTTQRERQARSSGSSRKTASSVRDRMPSLP
jgi:secretion/DNA translocation related TadE-like protein